MTDFGISIIFTSKEFYSSLLVKHMNKVEDEVAGTLGYLEPQLKKFLLENEINDD